MSQGKVQAIIQEDANAAIQSYKGRLFWLFIVGLFCYICIFYYLYVDSIAYAFGRSAFLYRITFCDTLVVIFLLSKHYHHKDALVFYPKSAEANESLAQLLKVQAGTYAVPAVLY
jgi:hypothetical protein